MVIKIKKTTAFFLLAAVLLGCTVAFFTCGDIKNKVPVQKDETHPPVADGSVSDDPAPEDPWFDDPLILRGVRPAVDDDAFRARFRDTDFTGETVRFLVADPAFTVNGGDTMNTRSIAPLSEDDNFSLNLAVKQRNEYVQDLLGVEIVLENACSTMNLNNRLRDWLLAGIHRYDVVSGCMGYTHDAAFFGDYAGKFIDLNALDPSENYLSLDAPYWDREQYEASSYNGHAYWITGELSLSYLGGMGVCFVNKTLWDENDALIASLPSAGGTSNLYKLYSSNRWSIDLLTEITKAIHADIDEDGKVSGGDTVGYIGLRNSSHNMMAEVLAAGSYVRFATQNADGMLVCSFDNNRNRLFATKLQTLYTQSNTLIFDLATKVDAEKKFAWGENVLVYAGYLNDAERQYLSTMKDEYVIMPPPMLYAGDPVGYTTDTNSAFSIYAIPVTAEWENRISLITATLECMACFSYEYVTPAYYDLVTKGAYTNENSRTSVNQARILNALSESRHADFGKVWNVGGSTIQQFFSVNATDKNIVSALNEQTADLRIALAKLQERLKQSGL